MLGTYKMLLKLLSRNSLGENSLSCFLAKIRLKKLFQQRQQRIQQHHSFSKFINDCDVIRKGICIYVAMLLKNIDICTHIEKIIIFYFFSYMKHIHFALFSPTSATSYLSNCNNRQSSVAETLLEKCFSNNVDFITVF
jgi:hypothetical protein